MIVYLFDRQDPNGPVLLFVQPIQHDTISETNTASIDNILVYESQSLVTNQNQSSFSPTVSSSRQYFPQSIPKATVWTSLVLTSIFLFWAAFSAGNPNESQPIGWMVYTIMQSNQPDGHTVSGIVIIHV